ncbi:MAG TPA: hypothetical protein VLB44_27745 [Kofleriaceae bacterium]|nr:hypothetical protein [Kofleriaceae bacterium]
MRARLTCIVLGFATSAAAAPAEDQLDTMQLALQPTGSLHAYLDDQPTDPLVRGIAFAQVAAGGAGGGGLGGGGAVAVAGIGCDAVDLSVHGRARPFADSEQLGGEARYGLCLSNIGLTLSFDGSRGRALAPGLDARRSLWSRRYEAVYDRMTMGFGEVYGHTIFLVSLGHGTTTQTDGVAMRTIKTIDFDFVGYRYRRPGLTVETLVWTGSSLKAGDNNLGGVTNAFLPARVHVERADTFVDAEAGWASSAGVVTASGSTEVNGKTTSSWTETIDSAGLPDMVVAVGKVEGGIRRDRTTASAGIARSLYPTFDGNLAREARISAAVSYEVDPRTKVTLSPFAARTHTWTRDAGDSRDLSAGAQLFVGRELNKQLRVDAIGEAGVSPYTHLDRDGVATSSLGGQVMVALTHRVPR